MIFKKAAQEVRHNHELRLAGSDIPVMAGILELYRHGKRSRSGSQASIDLLETMKVVEPALLTPDKPVTIPLWAGGRTAFLGEFAAAATDYERNLDEFIGVLEPLEPGLIPAVAAEPTKRQFWSRVWTKMRRSAPEPHTDLMNLDERRQNVAAMIVDLGQLVEASRELDSNMR